MGYYNLDFDLIIKNGLCFIRGNLERVDIGIKDSLIATDACKLYAHKIFIQC